MSYCASRFHTVRRPTREVTVGSVGVGGSHPIRLQSMTTSDTQDVAATVKQSIALAEVGCEIVRITAPNVAAARCLKDIRAQFTAAGFGHIPLVADIHFLPSAAMEAVEHVEKVRVNPGNYADKKKFAVREYSDSDYETELQRLHDAFSPLVKRARELGRALRIGTNHGSLSDRIMNRYGDTPLGMVESALEFLRIAESHSYHAIILSMKSSNPKVMIQAYRLLVERMAQEDMHYPLHLGVTEAGDGEDGRIKSAIGIGSLLLDGLGDTIRVSLTEDSVYEIPVARAIAQKAMSLWQPDSGYTGNDSLDPYHFTRRAARPLQLDGHLATGPDHPPRVITRLAATPTNPKSAIRNPQLKDTPAEGLLIAVDSAAAFAALPDPGAAFYVLELAPALTLPDLRAAGAALRRGTVLARAFGAGDAATLTAWATFTREAGCVLAVQIQPADFPALAPALRALGDRDLIFTLAATPSSAAHAALDPQHRRHRRAARQQLPLETARGVVPHRRPALRRARRLRQHRDRGGFRPRHQARLQRPAGRRCAHLQDGVRRVPQLRPHALRPADDDAAHPRADRSPQGRENRHHGLHRERPRRNGRRRFRLRRRRSGQDQSLRREELRAVQHPAGRSGRAPHRPHSRARQMGRSRARSPLIRGRLYSKFPLP
jgi:(E)-4-hydroxy-3-methylbut-2-enyl-diphosphate synthase